MDHSILPDLASRHRALGAVIGSAVGDALGATFNRQGASILEEIPRPVLGGIGDDRQ